MLHELPRQANLAESLGNGSFQRHTEDESGLGAGGKFFKNPTCNARQEIKQ